MDFNFLRHYQRTVIPILCRENWTGEKKRDSSKCWEKISGQSTRDYYRLMDKLTKLTIYEKEGWKKDNS